MKPRIDVFISSTAIDLPEYRDAVRKVITTLGLFPSGMETWPAGDENSVDRCKRMVEDAAIFVGIYAHRYGWCPPGYNGKGITELEYDWATAKGIPRLCFVVKKDYAWPPDQIETDAKLKLDAFKAQVLTNFSEFFTTADSLGQQVALALAALPQVRQLSEPEAVQCNFVPAPDRFVGRGDELAALNQALSNANAVTAVKGIGGIGKSTFVKAFAQQDTRFKMKLWAEVGQVAGEDLLPRILRQWTDEDFPPDWSLDRMVARSREVLTERAHDCSEPVLLLIDDVWMETVGQARRLRDAAPGGAQVLVTTRSEDVAAALDAYSAPLDALPNDQGASLMIDLVGEKAGNLRADLEALSAALGGHPLALTLAARQIRRDPTPTQARKVIDRIKRGVTSGEDFKGLKLDTGDSKLDSVSATLRLTLDELRPERQKQFRALGALPLDLPFRAVHAQAICGVDEDEASDMLSDLSAEGLIAAVPERDDWYAQHRLLRAYAHALLSEQNELHSAEQRHRDYLIQLADGTFRVKPPETWKALDDDLPQIHALGNDLAARLAGTDDLNEQDERLQAMSESAQGDTAQQDTALLQACENFGDAVYWYIFRRYVGAEGRRWLWAGLIAARRNEQQSLIGLFTTELGGWYSRSGDKRIALNYREQALATARAQNDKTNEATCLSNLGSIWDDLGEKQKALDFHGQALTLNREVGNRNGEAISLNNLGKVWDDLGDKQKALDFYGQALPILRETGDKSGEANTLNNIGKVWDDLGQAQKALDIYEQSLLLRREVEDKGGEANTLSNIGAAWDNLGEQAKALDFYAQAMPIKHEIGDQNGEAILHGNIAIILWEQGKHDEALAQAQTARDLEAAVGVSTELEDGVIMAWKLMIQLGLNTMDELNAYIAQWEKDKQARDQNASS
ncbi:MAG: tetratricopeptide repeat protein [Chloroflexota bacterium]